ncbi:hypothetical protein K437DRAFT_235251 [Tilletiaria anomala UBC 951]|uniref:Protein-serine/threonine kinase n=1 Tax=Tilletiaria anomala (strain ATCC 24038 / CBS 436.72 / UBC 951) TaxID=1037660 RepID=A0A066VXP1_TILAU|nr:uncharacterized protein K437DRAFT_235251 [Tilletiaria anomala UBC 951]KDN46482.1 hypothetical protein K437DRAFT_235251 [Tilletiaria anomala UBC 951]
MHPSKNAWWALLRRRQAPSRRQLPPALRAPLSPCVRFRATGSAKNLSTSAAACSGTSSHVNRRYDSPAASSSRTRTGNDPYSSKESALGRHFYLNKILEQWAARPATRMTLRQLIFFGKTLGKDRDKIIKSANYVRQELPIRIAHRIRDLQALPFVVMTNKHMEDVYDKYWAAFEKLRKFPLIKNMDDNERFCTELKGLLEDHLTIIPSLTVGIVESSHHLPPPQLDSFMERMLRSRISRRVLAEQHIALSEALDDPFHFFNDHNTLDQRISPEEASEGGEADMGDHIGIIYTHLSVSSVVRKGDRLLRKMFAAERGISESDPIIPEVTVDGDLGARFAYIPEHLEYIIFELLKNAMRATMRRELQERDDVPIRVTIVEGPEDEDIIIRVSDSGGGLPDVASQLGGPALASQVGALPGTLMSKSTTSAGAFGINMPGRAMQLSTADAFGGSQAFVDQINESMAIRPQFVSSSPDMDSGDDGAPVRSSYQVPFISSSSGMNANDALISFLCSFSNVRRRLELEAEMRKQQEEKGRSSGDIMTGGLGSSRQLEALLNMGTFKGTVREQVVGSHASTISKDLPDAVPSLSASPDLTGNQRKHPSWVPQQDNPTDSPSSSVASLVEGSGGVGGIRNPASASETGLGLPMTKVYCDFFGGSLAFRSLDGHSSDVYVRLPKLGTNKERIESVTL